MKKKKKIIIGILIAAVIAAAGITWYVMNQKNQKTGTKLFESQELKPGEGLENITLDQELKAGEYQAVIEYKCYSLEDKSPLNGGSAEFKLYVKE